MLNNTETTKTTKRKALLIGFQYQNEKKLPGIATDLYQVYYFLKKQGWKNSEIVIMTDIVKDEETEVLKDAILEKIVNSDILTFIEDCRERKQYIQFNSNNHYNNFLSIFTKIDNLFVYYTGHCKNEILILPDNSNISLELFKKHFYAKNVVCIMDCCEGGIKLPFILNNNIYRCREELNFVKSEIICISSSLEDEKSTTTKIGSFFTRSLISVLNDSSLSLFSILERIRKSLNSLNQTTNISASFPTLVYIPGFIYSSSPILLENKQSYIIVNLKDK